MDDTQNPQPDSLSAPKADPLAGRDVIAGTDTQTPSHDTAHESGLSDVDARVPGDAAPLGGSSATVDAPKDPLGSLPDTATTTETVSLPKTIDTNVSDRSPDKGLTDAVIPTKPGGADQQDVLDDATKDVVSKAPKRAEEGLINQFDLKWSELKHFVSTIQGDIDGELGDILAFVRSKL